ncbi:MULTISPECIES: hypothetical protein [Rhodomicrobium]|uniref:hypothetical protein n=1 Tax=Rhodomicrobium TaxID=1068 RepID=UPI000B4A5814|nr:MULTISPECIES: hypothetical protein [Rhodomicrobium]
MTAEFAYSDSVGFFRSRVSDPLRVAAVAPSGDQLAGLMTNEISPSKAPILKLGAGNGAFDRDIPPAAVYRITRRQPVGRPRRPSPAHDRR